MANDFGTVVTASITAGQLSDESLRRLTPGKTLVSLVERWGCNGGGSFFKTGRAGGDLSSFKPPVKRSKLSTEAVAERCCGTEVMADEPKEDVGGSYETVLKDVARENRDRKAVKSDDATVPEYLWEEHLLEDLKEREWDDIKLVKVRRVATWLRSKMLRWWKRKATTSYIHWQKDKYTLPDVEDKVEWISRNESCEFEWSNESFSWTKEGKGNYRAW
mgnify:CR=1 FL=1